MEILLYILGFVIVIYAQVKINQTYQQTSKERNETGISGVEVARKILDENGLEDIYVVQVSGTLTDHYDPSRSVIRLSKKVFEDDSIASLAVAAHECGHAIQKKEHYLFYQIRTFLVPVVNLVSFLGYFVLIISAFAGMMSYFLLGMMMLFATLTFQLVTLPVELDASKRAMKEIERLHLASKEELNSVKRMLQAAAMTYVASLVSTILNLIRLYFMAQDRN
ncbi:MAG: zinc metallopeptidase [Firmicutes bacterium]|nr:zinc metallopeptidase [Bacillota bacterium]